MIQVPKKTLKVGDKFTFMYFLVVRNAWEAIFILVRYMCEEKEEKTCPSWMLAVFDGFKSRFLKRKN